MSHVERQVKYIRRKYISIIYKMVRPKKQDYKQNNDIEDCNIKNKKCVKATNTSNKEVLYFDSVCSAGQHLDMIAGEIRLVCDGKHESAISRRNRCIYIFEYVEKNLPVEYIGLISSKKRRQLIEERGYLEWRDKIYDCTDCGKALLYSSQNHHKKNCNNSKKQYIPWDPEMLLDTDTW